MLLLAGCTGGSAKSDPSSAPLPSSDVRATGSPIEGTSTIEGVVVDDQTAPVAGVAIAVRSVSVGTTLQATTDEAGSFAVSNILGGQYHVFAAKLGYTSVTKAVTIEEGQTAKVTLTVSAIIVEQVFHDVIGPYKGFVACGFTEPGVSGVKGSRTWQCPSQTETVFGDAINDFDFELKQSNYNAIMGELRWSPTAVGTSQKLSLFLMPEDGGGSNWYCTNGGVSPVKMIYTVDPEMDQCSSRGSSPNPKVPETKTPLVFTVYLPFDSIRPTAIEQSSLPNVVFQQSYEAMATVFYGKDPEENFSAFPDA